MKAATAEQIAEWTNAVVALARVSLPFDHPRKRHIGGGALSEDRKFARAAESKLTARGIMPDRATIDRLAWGDVDLDALRAKKALLHEVASATGLIRDRLASMDLADVSAIAEALRPFVAKLRLTDVA